MYLREIDPYVRQAIVTSMNDRAKSDVYAELITPDCRLFYIISGKGSLRVPNATLPLSPGCAILFMSGTRYTWQLDEEGVSYIAINFDYTQNFSHIKKSFHPVHADTLSEDKILECVEIEDAPVLNSPLYLKDATRLEITLRTIAEEFYIRSEHTSQLLSSALKYLLVSIVKQVTETEMGHARGQVVVRRLIQYIENNYDKDLSNEVLAEYFHFNSSYLNRVFKKHVGISMHKFLLNHRLRIARDLLWSSTLPVSEIAARVGLSDVPHFIKAYKSHYGRSPGQSRGNTK